MEKNEDFENVSKTALLKAIMELQQRVDALEKNLAAERSKVVYHHGPSDANGIFFGALGKFF